MLTRYFLNGMFSQGPLLTCTAYSAESGHLFRSKSATCSDSNRPPSVGANNWGGQLSTLDTVWWKPLFML